MTVARPAHDDATFARTTDVGQVAVILDAAEACFSRGGYAGTALREIAERAGVSKSLLHYHFASKEQLFAEVQMRAYERLATRIAAAVRPVASGEERGLFAFDALLSTMRESNDLAVQAELWAGALSNEKLRTHVMRLREFMRELLVRSIGEILGDDLARLPMSVEEAADLVWATFNGLGIESAFGEAHARIDRAARALRQLAALALAPSPRPRAGQRPEREARGQPRVGALGPRGAFANEARGQPRVGALGPRGAFANEAYCAPDPPDKRPASPRKR